MRLKKRVYLVDFDNTLIDSKGVKSSIEKNLKKAFKYKISTHAFWDEYKLVSQKLGYPDTNLIAKRLSERFATKNTGEIKKLFYDIEFSNHLLPGATELLPNLNKIGRVIVYSLGESDFQLLKIRKSGIEGLVGAKNVIITQNKKQDIKTVINKFNKLGYKEVFVIDDRVDVLDSSWKHNSQNINVWLKFGKYKNLRSKHKSSVDFSATNLNVLNKRLKNLVCKIRSPINKKYYLIWKGLTDTQKSDLIAISQSDTRIKKFTHDTERFKNLQSLNTWEKKSHSIYTLTDQNQKFYGIIWFSPKTYKKYKHTFAIRIYKSARGKGLSEPFMKAVFSDFSKSDIWLEVDKHNEVAIALYKKFGFENVSKKPGSFVMALKSA